MTFLPSLAGLGAPQWRPEARGAFLGLGLATTRAHLLRAVIDGLAASVALLARSVAADIGGPLTALRVDGGLTRSRLLLQAQADLLQLPVEVCRTPDATALGVAALARLGHRGRGHRGRGGRPGGRAVGHRAADRPGPRRPSGWRRSSPGCRRSWRRRRDRRAPRDRGRHRRRGRRGRHGDRPRAVPLPAHAWCCWTRPTTSAPGPPRRTPRSCTPGSTRCPAAWRAACCAAAAPCSGTTRRGRGSRSSAPARCSWPGPPNRNRRSRRSPTRPVRTGTPGSAP